MGDERWRGPRGFLIADDTSESEESSSASKPRESARSEVSAPSVSHEETASDEKESSGE